MSDDALFIMTEQEKEILSRLCELCVQVEEEYPDDLHLHIDAQISKVTEIIGDNLKVLSIESLRYQLVKQLLLARDRFV